MTWQLESFNAFMLKWYFTSTFSDAYIARTTTQTDSVIGWCPDRKIWSGHLETTVQTVCLKNVIWDTNLISLQSEHSLRAIFHGNSQWACLHVQGTSTVIKSYPDLNQIQAMIFIWSTRNLVFHQSIHMTTVYRFLIICLHMGLLTSQPWCSVLKKLLTCTLWHLTELPSYLSTGWVDANRAIQLLLGCPTFHSCPESLCHLSSIWTQIVETNDSILQWDRNKTMSSFM